MGDSRTYDVAGQGLGRGNRKIATFVPETGLSDGSLASTLKPEGSGLVDIVTNYKWTLTDTTYSEEIPYIRLVEYKCNDTQLVKQASRYIGGAQGVLEASAGNKHEILEVYKSIFPKDNPTGFSYKFPYFNATGFELRTSPWQALDSAGEGLSEMASGAQNIAETVGAQKVAKGIGLAKSVAGAAAGIGKAALAALVPTPGEADRPKVFMGHESRSITISFPLYNTVDETDWQDNRDFIYTIMSQNLFNKRDFIAGVPPVFYDVYIPGQYYCYASAMTDIKVNYLGNQRLLYGDFVVPDAYQIDLTLTELVMPSKNQFEAVTNGAAKNQVTTSTKNTEAIKPTDIKSAPQAAKIMNENKNYTGAAYMGMGGR